MRRTAKLLRDLVEESQGGKLPVADSRALPGVIDAFAFALADLLKEIYVRDQGSSYQATLHPPYPAEPTEAARALGMAARHAQVG